MSQSTVPATADLPVPAGPAGDERVRAVRDYAEDVFHRGRRPMEPIGFQPNWADQPSKHTTYLGVDRLPLPATAPADLRPVGDVLFGTGTGKAGWTLESLAELLRLSVGLLERRLRVSWNQDIDVRLHLHDALWSRGSASGGGMYPLEVYWVSGPSGPLTPGLYHYSTAHHALERLATGDLTDRVRAAIGATGPETDQFLLVSVRFWKNAYKYNSFCYHVVTQDTGALLGTWELAARGMDRPMRRVLWFHDRRLNDLLGLDGLDESVLAVVPLDWTGAASVVDGAPVPDVRRPAPDRFERSATVLRFDQVERTHLATLVEDEPRPSAEASITAPVPSIAPSIPLPEPPPEHRGTGTGSLMRVRRSSFGGFVSRPPLSLDEVGTVLAGSASGRRYRSDVTVPDAPLTRLYLLANRVGGLVSGSYGYDAETHALAPIRYLELDEFLQRNYYLTNYNLEQVGAVLAISATFESALSAYGSRGYRIVNAEVGAVAQTAYLAAAAAGIGCGAVLGFDNIAIDEVVGLDRSDERTFLFLLLGHERPDTADYDYRLA
jgi:SagB-type dehydrogenase family enzyme